MNRATVLMGGPDDGITEAAFENCYPFDSFFGAIVNIVDYYGGPHRPQKLERYFHSFSEGNRDYFLHESEINVDR